MAGYSTVYVFGKPGGVMGCDGVNQIEFMLLEGSASRMWYSVQHFTNNYAPMGKVEVFIPQGPYDPFNILDACLLFAPQLFVSCSSLEYAQKGIGFNDRIDFDSEPHLITPEWRALRSEAYDIYSKMPAWKGELKRMKL